MSDEAKLAVDELYAYSSTGRGLTRRTAGFAAQYIREHAKADCEPFEWSHALGGNRIFCPYCGYIAPYKMRYCPECGRESAGWWNVGGRHE